MSTAAATHADWLALVEPSGPFLTLPVLRRGFPAGLDRTPPALRAEFRERRPGPDADAAARTAWIDWVLQTGLRYGPMLRSGPEVPDMLQHYVAEHATLLRPDHALVGRGPAGEHTRLLINVYPPGTSWSAHLPGERWAATPVERMALLCRATGVPLGLLTDGDRFTLVHAPREAAVGTATWPASLFSEERVLLDSFLSVLGARRFFSVGATETPEALLADSANAQAEVTNQLGKQVRQAVELLVGAFSRANRERHGALLDDVDPHDVYAAAVTVMMRLVFLLYAEERHLLPLGDVLYDASYAASTLREALQQEADLLGEETLERRAGAWHRLLALFRAVSSGIAHDRLRIPAYGGSLFDPDRYPFLEGRQPGEPWEDGPSEPLPVDDLSVLALLSALQVLVFTEGGVREARRLSFRSLDVEQIGHVYEGLLDHGVRRIDEVVLGLVGRKGDEPERPLAALESRRATSRYTLVDFVVEETGKSDRYVNKALEAEPNADECRLLLAACDNDQAIYERVLPYAGLLRPDLRGLPTVFLPGSVVVTEVSSRRDSGTQYTTRDLADEIVRYTLEPLVYSPGPAEGAEPADWKLKPSEEILALKVCDPAVGSGAILVAACRYLAERVVEAWVAEGLADSRPEVDLILGDEPDDALMRARRAVVDHCLYGVDRDPMAVEMAKLSLWLTTMSRERPFSFLDHALRSGDSLLGITDLAQVEHLHLDPDEGRRIHATLFDYTAALAPLVKTAVGKRRQLEAIPVLTVRDAEAKAQLNAEANAALKTVAIVADIVVGAALSTAGHSGGPTLNDRLRGIANKVALAVDPDLDAFNRVNRLRELEERAGDWLNEGRPDEAPERSCLHWPVVFPEVFADRDRPGFDALVGNPPFLGGTRISGASGSDYREYLGRHIAGSKTNRADLVAFFFRRASRIATAFGFLSTNSISQGDTRSVALEPLIADGWTMYRGVKSCPWPGGAAVQVAKLWIRKDHWAGHTFLDNSVVRGITPNLDAETAVSGSPLALIENHGVAFSGCKVDCSGFLLEPSEAAEFLNLAENRAIVRRYLTSDDLNTSPVQQASRWVIDFGDRSRSAAERFTRCWNVVKERVEPVVLEKSKAYASWHRRWWQFWNVRPAMREALTGLSRVLVIGEVSKVAQPAFVEVDQVLSHRLIAFALDDDFDFGVLASSFHWWWTQRYASTLGNTTCYSVRSVFETFPRPKYSLDVARAGRLLDECRRQLMLDRKEGLTKIYNRLGDSTETDSRIQELRELHAALDASVARAYGWEDLKLEYGFHEMRWGSAYTLEPSVRDEILDRLLELNHKRHAAEHLTGTRGGTDRSKRSLRNRGARRGDSGSVALGDVAR